MSASSFIGGDINIGNGNFIVNSDGSVASKASFSFGNGTLTYDSTNGMSIKGNNSTNFIALYGDSGSLVSQTENKKVVITNGQVYLNRENTQYSVLSVNRWGDQQDIYGSAFNSQVSSKFISFGNKNSQSDTMYQTSFLLNYGLNPSGYTEDVIVFGNQRIRDSLIVNESITVSNIIVKDYLKFDNNEYFTSQSTNGILCSGNLTVFDKLIVYDKLTVSDVISGAKIYNTEDIGNNAYFDCNWKDGSTHSIITRDSNGLDTYVGWSGNGKDGNDYTTTLVLRGKAVRLKSTTGTSVASDERFKNSFKSLDEFDDVFMDLEPCAFKYNNGTSNRYHFGFKAQNVRDAFLKHGYTTKDFGGFIQWKDDPESDDYCGVKDPMGLIYTEFQSWNVRMTQKNFMKIKELQDEINALKKKLEELKDETKRN